MVNSKPSRPVHTLTNSNLKKYNHIFLIALRNVSLCLGIGVLHMNSIPKVHDKSTIKKLAEDKFPHLNQQLSTSKQLRFGKKGSIVVDLEGDKAGLFFNFEEGKGGTLISDPKREVYRYGENGLVLRINENGRKRFLQTHIDPETQQWVNKAPKEGYGLFEKPTDSELSPVLCVEGEKSVNRAKRRFPEYHVVTWQGGTGNLNKNIKNGNFKKFKGRQITCWADNDLGGIQAMETLAEHLTEIGNSVSLVDLSDLPEKWDLGDDNPDKIDLRSKLSNAIQHELEHIGKTVDEIMAMEFSPPKFVIPNLAPVGSMLLSGDPKDGKSVVSLCLTKMVLDSNPEANAFLFDIEQFADEFQERLQMLNMDIYGNRLRTMNQEEYNERFRNPEKLMTAVESVLKRYKPSILVMDTVTKCLEGIAEDYVSVDSFMSQFSYLAKAHDCLIVLNYHNNKSTGTSKATHRVMGSVGFVSACDVIMVIERMDNNASTTVLSDLKAQVTGKRLRITDEYLRFNVVSSGFGFELAPFDVLDNLKPYETVKNNIAMLLRDSDSPLNQTQIVERYNMSYLSMGRNPIQKGEVSVALGKLVKEEIITRHVSNSENNQTDYVVWECKS